eukprot:SM000026S08911  [mRNA]  locus=s26:437783:442802:+ [translate_table: standard]
MGVDFVFVGRGGSGGGGGGGDGGGDVGNPIVSPSSVASSCPTPSPRAEGQTPVASTAHLPSLERETSAASALASWGRPPPVLEAAPRAGGRPPLPAAAVADRSGGGQGRGGGSDGSRPSAQLARDLEVLWQRVTAPSADSSTTAAESTTAESSLDERWASPAGASGELVMQDMLDDPPNRFVSSAQAPAMDVTEEDFLRGLDWLVPAFDDLDDLLLPPPPPALVPPSAPAGAATDALVGQSPMPPPTPAPPPLPSPPVLPSQPPQAGAATGGAIQMLVAVAHAIVEGDPVAVQRLMADVNEVASVYGDASQRLCAYFLEGLVARTSSGGRSIDECSEADVPLEFHEPDCGRQIMEAFQALAARPGGPPCLRMTAIDLPALHNLRAYCILEAGERLKSVAAMCKVPFEYQAIGQRIDRVKASMITLRANEVLAVNCSLRLHQLLDETATPSNPRKGVLKMIRELNPSIVALVEQNAHTNSPFFLARFYEALFYYAGVFESIDASIPRYIAERRLYEQRVLGRAIVNVVACEGKDRVERQEPLGVWQRRFMRAGFVGRPLNEKVVATVQGLLAVYREGYGLHGMGENSLILSWQDRSLLAMSAWQPDHRTWPDEMYTDGTRDYCA